MSSSKSKDKKSKKLKKNLKKENKIKGKLKKQKKSKAPVDLVDSSSSALPMEQPLVADVAGSIAIDDPTEVPCTCTCAKHINNNIEVKKGSEKSSGTHIFGFGVFLVLFLPILIHSVFNKV